MDTKERNRTGRPRRRTAPKRPEQEQARPSQDVVYMPPKPFNRNRLILRLGTIAAVVIAVMLGLSVFFKVKNIEISGMKKYTAWDIEQASGIQKGDNLLTFGKARASGKIISNLRYVQSVRIGIKLPDTVKIEVIEVEVTYAVQDSAGKWWLISSQGRVIEQLAKDPETAETKILGVKLLNPVLGQNAAAYQQEQPTTDEEGNVIPVTITAAQRLKMATDIAASLEENGIIGKAESIDVTNMGEIQLNYNKFQVILGDGSQLDVKIKSMQAAMSRFISSNGGILDITDPNKIQFQES